ncbi:SDR family NAD(P)-dependent oxidoreductase [Halosimplex amylolyticum]|uniref:SDR family NAD(P)-dependent oxidoreductase n=1 Tax=Halosimplex amylolyticum TaxID=3396616 RepID=UPI003F578FDD
MTDAPPDDGSALGDGHVALVTGSTDGIGEQTARNLAETGATVIVHGRDREKGQRLVAELPGDGHAFYEADFTDVSDVRGLANAVVADFDRLDCLVNNAGTMQSDRHLVDVPGSDEGIEMSFAVNHLAPFLLTNLLADRLAATGERRTEERGDASGADADPARVVTVSSDLHRQATLDLEGVRGPDAMDGLDAYNHSKLANVLFTFELARRLPDSVTATCCHPGVSPLTGLARDSSSLMGLGWTAYGYVGGLLGLTDSAAESAETQTYLARSPAVTGVTGAYFDDCERVEPAAAADDRDAQRELWRASVEWLALGDDEAVGVEEGQVVESEQ